MSKLLFVFDLDSTLTKKEILPEIAKEFGLEEKIRKITEDTMQGKIPFEVSFRNRVNMLKDIPVDRAQEIVKNIPLNDEMVGFIKNNKSICYIVTGNLDVFISKIIDDMGMADHCICSKCLTKNNKIVEIVQIIDKKAEARKFKDPFVVVGDGSNDVGMAELSKFTIGFGGVRPLAKDLKKVSNFICNSDKECARLLETLKKGDIE